MKIIEDEVMIYPPHAICKADIQVIFSSVPAVWTDGIKTVRLSAALDPRRTAYYSSYNHIFTITSRSQTKKHALYQVLLELAAHGLGVEFRRRHKLQERDESRLHHIVAPLVEEILPQLSQKKVWLDR